MKFNEDTRVKIPAILHLCRLGYTYLSKKEANINSYCNIFTDIFLESISRINPETESEEIERYLEDIKILLDNEDLGQAFFQKLTARTGIKLLDFANFENNSFHVVTELTYKNGEDEFRPDITLLINGMPLVFIEVKKPNNKEGVLAERKRINTRCQNKKFRRFINITQLMVFSNNMEYDNLDIEPIQGAFYASPSYGKPIFNYFREEGELDLTILLGPENEEVENYVLKDNNLVVIKHSPEFLTNKDPQKPTNKICTSLFSKDRLAFLLNYSLAYVKEDTGIQKHVMRYPQIFATKAIEKKLTEGVQKGIIWHTQGSGKTALAYYNVKFLTDFFHQKGVIPKFYFIVDRIDLLLQAKKEFSSRGLIVHTVNSREEFIKDIQTSSAIHNLSGKQEITVVNIQKFSEDSNVLSQQDYNIQVQRVYFLDEVHRSYNPKGSFLANLSRSDPNAIKIGLTGTPLISKAYYSRDLFGDYIHKYYYNASIADGYTLRLIREEIETSYKMLLEKALKEIEIIKGEIHKREVYAHHQFVEPMLEYIVNDFENSRTMHGNTSIGAMVVCDSSDQAKAMYEIFQEKYAAKKSTEYEREPLISLAAEEQASFGRKMEVHKSTISSAALILHDIGSKEDRKKWVQEFKEGKIDILFVYNMLLTGFDAKRLKKLYLGRVIKSHNLLQTLTRVNRPYQAFRYGFVVDFADIRKEFDATNRAYYDELKEELGDEIENYSQLFKSKEEIEAEIEEIKEVLFEFDTNNAAEFSTQISQIRDRAEVIRISKVLDNAKSLYNLIRHFGYDELLEKVDFRKLTILSRETQNHLALLNTKEALDHHAETTNLLNLALEDVIFEFEKIGEEELKLADELKDTLRKTREELLTNFDKKDPEFISLYEELERLFKNKQLNEVSQEDMVRNIGSLRKIYDKVKELNRKNKLLKAKYQNDPKFARIHKRLREKGTISQKERKIFEALQAVKKKADEQVLINTQLLHNEHYLEQSMMKKIIQQLKPINDINLTPDSAKYINTLVVKEYINEFHGRPI